MLRKLLSGMLIVAMSASLLAGCGKTEEPANVGEEVATEEEGDVVIEWWTPNWDEVESREMVAEFETENPDIKVELVITDWDTYKSKITTAISADGAPELFTILLSDVAPFAKKGLLEPLTTLGGNAGIAWDDIVKASLDIVSVDEDYYAVPFRYDGSGIFYNVDVLAEYDYTEFPETWDEMVEMAKLIAADGKYAFAWPLGNQANAVTRLVQQLYTYGGDILNEDETECLLNSEAAVKALTTIVSSIEEGYASPSSAEVDNTKMREMFGSGQLVFNFTGPFDMDALKEEYPELNFATACIPGNGGMGCTTANGWCVSMAANTGDAEKEAAAKFLAYITTPENQSRLTDSFPASYTALEYEQYATEEFAPFIKQLDNSKAEPTYENWAEIEPIIYEYIQSAVAGVMTVEDACNAMTEDINALISY